MENIIKATRQSLAITQREVAQKAGMSPQAVMRYEQGLYENLSMKLAMTIAELRNESVAMIILDYDKYRSHTQRSATKHLLTPPPIHFTESLHPFLNFRQQVTTTAVGNNSRMAFCILLAVHPATVAEYDSGRVRTMPALIHRALVTGGLSEEYLRNLIEFGEIWYERYAA